MTPKELVVGGVNPHGIVRPLLPFGSKRLRDLKVLSDVRKTLGRSASAVSLAAAAGVAPVLGASGATSYRRMARRGNKVLKRVPYHSAFSCIPHHRRSETFYGKRWAEGKGHHQAVIALARKRVHVLWAMLRDERTYTERPSLAA